MILAALGASLLLVVALARWGIPSDEYAYWLAAKRLVAGLPLYDPSVTPGMSRLSWHRRLHRTARR
jgi:hypothetical protein